MSTLLSNVTWKITQVEKSLKAILARGDKLIFREEGDTCGCICVDRKGQRRGVWENAYVCENSNGMTLSKRPSVSVTGISGAMLSPGHPPYLLDIALCEFGSGSACLIGDIYESGEHPGKPIAKRVAAALKQRKGSLKSLTASELRELDGDGPLGHATGQWHAEL